MILTNSIAKIEEGGVGTVLQDGWKGATAREGFSSCEEGIPAGGFH